MNLLRIVLPVICLSFNVMYVQAQGAGKLVTFKKAKISREVSPLYPYVPLRKIEDGWVVVNVMVDKAGNTFEPTVEQSMGSPEFRKAALRAIRYTKFTPATSSGKPVASGYRLRYAFSIKNRVKKVHSAFATSYRRFITFLNRGERENADIYLAEMEKRGARSLYEDAFLNLAKFHYAAKYGNPEFQMRYLSKALFFDNDKTFETYLPKETAKKLWPHLFALQVKNNRFEEALDTLEIMKKTEGEKTIRTMAAVAKQIKLLRMSNIAYKIPAQINNYGHWSVELYKDKFYLNKAQSNIDEIKLRCAKKYVLFKYVADTKYNVPNEYGKCDLEVLGKANTSFELVQLK